jgi:hypothetical protein
MTAHKFSLLLYVEGNKMKYLPVQIPVQRLLLSNCSSFTCGSGPPLLLLSYLPLLAAEKKS